MLKHPAEKGAPYPGVEVLFAYAETNCLPPFEAYVGLAYDASSLTAGSIVPKEDGWKNGQRSITCYVGSADETPVTGSLKGSHGSRSRSGGPARRRPRWSSPGRSLARLTGSTSSLRNRAGRSPLRDRVQPARTAAPRPSA